MADPRAELTSLLRSWSGGDQSARDQLIEIVYEELRGLAHQELRKEFGKRTLQTTELVHEAYIRLIGPDKEWGGRAHFFGAAARAMRQILVERARTRKAVKRGGGGDIAATLDETMVYVDDRAGEVLELDQALTRLGSVSERAARIVEMKCFVGMTMQEISVVIDVSIPTVERDWRTARAWLMRELTGNSAT